jgi:hypothetical protein
MRTIHSTQAANEKNSAFCLLEDELLQLRALRSFAFELPLQLGELGQQRGCKRWSMRKREKVVLPSERDRAKERGL